MRRSSVFLMAMFVVAAPGSALAQSQVSTETIEKWNAEGREQIRRLEADKAKAEQRERERRLKALKENAELHERLRKLQTEIDQLSSPSQMPTVPSVRSAATQPASTEAAPVEPKQAPPKSSKTTRQNEKMMRRDAARQSAKPENSQDAAPQQRPTASKSDYTLVETVALKTVPEGATAQTSLGGACETPCLMEVSTDRSFSVTFSHRGYLPKTVDVAIQVDRSGVSDPRLTPNPVYVELVPAAKQ